MESGAGGRGEKVGGSDEGDEMREAHGNVEARLEKVLRRVGLEGKTLDRMK